MDGVDSTMQVLARWVDDNGYRTINGRYAREVYLHCYPDHPEDGVTELQLPVARSRAHGR